MPATSVSHRDDFKICAELADRIDRFVAEHEASWIAYRRERHCSPEPSGEERETSHSICERLKALGIAAKIPERGVGVVGDLFSDGATEVAAPIAVRADIDALRMADRKDVDYASIKEGVAHACGHDVHTTVVLGVAELLSHLKRSGEPIPDVPVRFIFQAAEETCDGATWMVEDGVVDQVQSIIGLHVEPNLTVGHIGICHGVLTAQVDEVFITVQGRGGHTARPHNTTDPMQAAAMLITSLYQLLPRSCDVRDASVFTVGQINGGSASNVIPDQVRLSGTLRTTSVESREQLMQKIADTCQHLGALTGNEIVVDFRHPLGSVFNAEREIVAFEQATRDVLGNAGVVNVDRPSMGGEDFAMYLAKCQGAQIRLGCATSLPWPHLHSPVFDVDERTIAIGVRVMTRTVLQLATQYAATGSFE